MSDNLTECCSVCKEEFTARKNLTRHMKNAHNIIPLRYSEYPCELCNCYYRNAESLRKHKEKYHNLVGKIVKPSDNLLYKCKDCAFSASEHISIKKHLTNFHGNANSEEILTFENYEAFEEWKLEIEAIETALFVKHRGDSVRNDGSKVNYFICHRSGSFHPSKNSQNKRHLKTMGSCKIESKCPAQMTVTISTKKEVKVVYFPIHLGHAADLGHIHLTSADRSIIAGKLATGVTVKRILDDIRSGELLDIGEHAKRLELICRRDIINIQNKYGFNKEEQLHASDVISVDMWVTQMKALEDDNPVLFYKPQGELHETLESKDFMLVFSINGQLNMAQKFSNKVICIDSTHGLNDYDFQLTTIMVIDEYGEGFPISFCFSNRIDAVAMKVYFAALKEKTGCLSPYTFMSDDAPAYINAWKEVMNDPPKVLLCAWHVDKSWRNRLMRIPKAEQCYIYKVLRVLLEETDVAAFENRFDSFIDSLQKDTNPLIKEFGEYFKRNYANRKEMWAYCFRIDCKINCNMYLESMHRIVKHIYLEGKKVKRLDKSTSVLMKFAKDCLFERKIKLHKGKVTNAISQIRKKHKLGAQISKEDIEVIDENNWLCTSQNNRNDKYKILKNISICNNECKLRCEECNICAHNFTCSCVDNIVHNTICKHIHAVILSSNSVVLNSQRILIEEAQLDQDIRLTRKLQMPEHNIEEKMLFAMGLWESIKNNVDDLTKSNVETKLNSLILQLKQAEQVIAKNVDVLDIQNDGSGLHPKKAEKQTRFFSTKRKRGEQNLSVKKPTYNQKQSIIKTLENPESSEINIHNDLDHVY